MAPLAVSFAATLAAGVAVRAGVAAARVELERRAQRRGRREQRQFALLPGEPLAAGLRRVALGQLGLALELLGADGGAPPDARAVHETRKALKRMRALLRLLRSELGEQAYARESATLRDAARRLAAARDAEVMLGTLDALRARHPRKLERGRGLGELRARLVSERETAFARTLADPALLARAIAELRAQRARFAGLSLRDAPDLQLVEDGLRRVYRQGRGRYRRAARADGDPGLALHEWRKRVKDLRYAGELLDRANPHPAQPRLRKRRRPARGPLRRLARRADDLGELLGEEHDLALLGARVRSDPALAGRTRRAAAKLIARRRRRLRRRALRDGEQLYRRRPRRFVARVQRAFARAQRAPAASR